MFQTIRDNLFNSYTMGTSGLPDIYTRSPRAAGPRAEGVYIRRTMSAHGITITRNKNTYRVQKKGEAKKNQRLKALISTTAKNYVNKSET